MNRIYLYLLFTLFFVLAVHTEKAFSQVVNVERHRVAADTTGIWTGGLGFGLNISKNKNQITRFNNTADLTYIGQKHDILLLGRNNFLRVEGENVLNDGYVHLRSVLYRDNRWAPELFIQGQYNMDWGLKRRGLAGANLRYRMISSESFSAFISTGLMFEHEWWEDTDTDSDKTFERLKSTTSFNVQGKITESLDMMAITYYQARPTDFFNPRFTSDWQVRFHISQHLRFVVQFVSTYDAAPPFRSSDFIYSLNNVLEVRF
ncbi:DUF481 domain-containing protein [Balneolaceae bacterium ANBcel3]|nr:DUF481 domain-containing protein [Balneolaceae bacterium ANBcel3]